MKIRNCKILSAGILLVLRLVQQRVIPVTVSRFTFTIVMPLSKTIQAAFLTMKAYHMKSMQEPV